MGLKWLFIGDVVGDAGIAYVQEVLPRLIAHGQPDLVVANGENASGGRGLRRRAAEQLYDAGVEIITLGNHAFDQKETETFIDEDARIVRPANYPDGTPGRAYTICRVKGRPVLIINVMGRTYLSALDCPFRTVDRILAEHAGVRHVLVDFHAETTSEKQALAWYLDGRVSAVIGTHTHVPTADERVLPKGTAFITDVGMTGPRDGIIGIERDAVIQKFLTQMPVKFGVAAGPRQLCAVWVHVDDESGRAVRIQRVYTEER
jgi:metallophosphoesterase (TIGR00282 family)